MKILTVPGEEFEILDPTIRGYLCYLDDGRLFVSKAHESNPHVRAFMARLRRLGRPVQVHYVDMSAIEHMYAEALGIPMAARLSRSQMQHEASVLFQRAVSLRASDIHIRVSKRKRTQIYFRVNNDLEFVTENSTEYGEQLCTAIYQSMADVSDATFETLTPQDARISDKSKLPDNLDGIRIATSPQVDGFIMVLRLLYNDACDSTSLLELGYTDQQIDGIIQMKRRPSGINIIGGPTGSGKSTTLQRVLTSIYKDYQGRKHVITVEDPPEYPILGAVQTPVTNADTEEERSRQFQIAIKAAMRLDPDVIMIGEIRDKPSARLAVQAAMTGHQVWSTVHANNAIAIVDRLIDLGVPHEFVCDPTIVSGLICQRLVKVLCPGCKQPLTQAMGRYPKKELQRIASVIPLDAVYARGEGCSQCRHTGIAGRTVVAEVIVTDETLMSYLRKNDRMGALYYWRHELGGITMLQHAIAKIAQGIVDPFLAEEIVGPLEFGQQDPQVITPKISVVQGHA